MVWCRCRSRCGSVDPRTRRGSAGQAWNHVTRDQDDRLITGDGSRCGLLAGLSGRVGYDQVQVGSRFSRKAAMASLESLSRINRAV